MRTAHSLGLRTGKEQCWSSQERAVRWNSSKLLVDTIPLKDSNSGLMIMLNCRTQVKEHVNTEGGRGHTDKGRLRQAGLTADFPSYLPTGSSSERKGQTSYCQARCACREAKLLALPMNDL